MDFGLSSQFEYTEFEFDSFDCNESKNPAYYSQDWPNFYVGKPLNNVAAIKVLEAQIPFTFYVINSTNNIFTLKENSLAQTSVHVTIPPGNYSYTSLPGILAAALNTASPNSWTYSVAYNPSQLNITISSTLSTTVAAPRSFDFIFSDVNGNSTPRLALGFPNGTSASTVVPSSSTGTMTLVAPSVLQLAGPNYIYINSSTLGALIHLYLPGNGVLNSTGMGADGPQIAKIPMTVNSGQVYNWMDPNPLMWFDLGNSLINGTIDFYCTLGTGPDNVPVQFNGNSFSLKLGVLTNTSSRNNWLGGGKQNDRAVVRTAPLYKVVNKRQRDFDE